MKARFFLTMAVLAVALTLSMNAVQARGFGGGGRAGAGGFGGGGGGGRGGAGGFGGGGGGGGGGFSRGGAAASGSFSGGGTSASKSASRSQTAQTASTNRAQTAQTASTNRAATQQSRQSTTSANQSQRQATAQSAQHGYYGSGYHPPAAYAAPAAAGYYRPPAAAYAPAARAEYYDNHTVSNEEAAAVMLGTAAVSYAAGKSRSAQTASAATAPPSGGLPCNPTTKAVKGVTYYQCGSNWYTQAYGSTGVMYMPVPPPQ